MVVILLMKQEKLKCRIHRRDKLVDTLHFKVMRCFIKEFFSVQRISDNLFFVETSFMGCYFAALYAYLYFFWIGNNLSRLLCPRRRHRILISLKFNETSFGYTYPWDSSCWRIWFNRQFQEIFFREKLLRSFLCRTMAFIIAFIKPSVIFGVQFFYIFKIGEIILK